MLKEQEHEIVSVESFLNDIANGHMPSREEALRAREMLGELLTKCQVYKMTLQRVTRRILTANDFHSRGHRNDTARKAFWRIWDELVKFSVKLNTDLFFWRDSNAE